MEVNGQLQAPSALPPGKEPPVPNCIRGWVGLRAGLDAVVKTKINVTDIITWDMITKNVMQ
jgi:hypothetical protein